MSRQTAYFEDIDIISDHFIFILFLFMYLTCLHDINNKLIYCKIWLTRGAQSIALPDAS